MSISETARPKLPIDEMPEGERPISEKFRIVAKQWAEANAAAKLLEETRQSVFSRLVMNRREERLAAVDAKNVTGKKPWTDAGSVATCEHIARASDEYQEHVYEMCKARAKADLLRVQMKYLEMVFSEWQSSDANARRERQMGRKGT